jgi:hypothetical protein
MGRQANLTEGTETMNRFLATAAVALAFVVPGVAHACDQHELVEAHTIMAAALVRAADEAATPAQRLRLNNELNALDDRFQAAQRKGTGGSCDAKDMVSTMLFGHDYAPAATATATQSARNASLRLRGKGDAPKGNVQEWTQEL